MSPALTQDQPLLSYLLRRREQSSSALEEEGLKSKPRQPSPRLRTLGSVYTLAPQIVVHGPGASASPGSQGEMQNLGSHPTPTDFASAISSRSPSDSFVRKSLRSAGLGLSLGAGASTQSQIPTPHPSLSSRGQRARLQNHPSHLP